MATEATNPRAKHFTTAQPFRPSGAVLRKALPPSASALPWVGTPSHCGMGSRGGVTSAIGRYLMRLALMLGGTEASAIPRGATENGCLWCRPLTRAEACRRDHLSDRDRRQRLGTHGGKEATAIRSGLSGRSGATSFGLRVRAPPDWRQIAHKYLFAPIGFG